MRYRIYRNLNNGKLSIKDKNSLVIGHCDAVQLMDVKLIVSTAGSKRVKETKQRNVHAYIEGEITYLVGFVSFKSRDCVVAQKICPVSECEQIDILTYNPHVHNFFVAKDTQENAQPKWDCAFITKHGNIHVGNN